MQPIDFYIGLLITNFVVISGWIVSVYLSKAALRRQQRVAALTEAYQVLVQVGIDKGKPGRILGNGEFLDYSRDLENAVSTIHLFGNECEVLLVNELVTVLSNANYYSPEPLINALRTDIRKQMSMSKLRQKPTYLVQSVRDNRKPISKNDET